MQCPSTPAQFDKCNRLLDEAEQLISEQGIVSFKLSQVPKNAQISNNGFYKMYESKEDLLVCCFLRNATSNYFQGFLDQYPDTSAVEKMLLPIIFTFEAIHFRPVFNVVRQIAVNRAIWRLASDDKIKAFEQRINQYWGWIRGFLADCVSAGELEANDEELTQLTQAITFYLSGATSAYQSQLINETYLQEQRATLFKQLQLVLNNFRWQQPLSLTTFERVGVRVHFYYKQNQHLNGSCQGCKNAQQQG